MSLEFNCSQCQSHLFDLVDNTLGDADRRLVNDHLAHCEACTDALAGIWEMQSVATRWQDARVPRWARRDHFFERHQWFPALQVASACASFIVLVLVMAQVHISIDKGVDIDFGGGNYVSKTEVANQLDKFRAEQRQVLDHSVDRLTAQQVASNQLILGSVLATSRKERREDLSTLAAAFQSEQDRQSQQMQASLRYLASGQIEDRRDIKQLGHAIQLVANDGGTL